MRHVVFACPASDACGFEAGTLLRLNCAKLAGRNGGRLIHVGRRMLREALATGMAVICATILKAVEGAVRWLLFIPPRA